MEKTITNENLKLLKRKKEFKKRNYFFKFCLIFTLFAIPFFFYNLNTDKSENDGVEKTVGKLPAYFNYWTHTPDGKFRYAKQDSNKFLIPILNPKKHLDFTIFYDTVNMQNQKFCGLDFEPYFNLKNPIKNVDLGDRYYNFKLAMGQTALRIRNFNRSYHLLTKHWHLTSDNSKIDVYLENRWLKTPEDEMNQMDIAKRFTKYDGFIKNTVEKTDNENALRAVLENHDCKFRSMTQFNLERGEEFQKFCDFYTKHPEKKWVQKHNIGCHGAGMELVKDNARLDEICAAGKHKLTKLWKGKQIEVVMQEFMANPKLINGHNFHVRFIGFLIADPFVTYWAPRHSYWRFSGKEYGTKTSEEFITNSKDCKRGNNNMGCYAWDTDFLGLGWVSKEKWFRATEIMAKHSHMILKAFYGRKIFEGETSRNRFMWFGFDYMIDEDWNPIFTEWNEESALRDTDVPIIQTMYGNFFDGMFSIASGYTKKIPQNKIDAISRQYNFLKIKPIGDGNDWVL